MGGRLLEKELGEPAAGEPKLHDAELTIAREHGFASRAALKKAVATREAQSRCERVWTDSSVSSGRGDVPGLTALIRACPALRESLDAPLFDFGAPAIRVAVDRKNLRIGRCPVAGRSEHQPPERLGTWELRGLGQCRRRSC